MGRDLGDAARLRVDEPGLRNGVVVEVDGGGHDGQWAACQDSSALARKGDLIAEKMKRGGDLGEGWRREEPETGMGGSKEQILYQSVVQRCLRATRLDRRHRFAEGALQPQMIMQPSAVIPDHPGQGAEKAVWLRSS